MSRPYVIATLSRYPDLLRSFLTNIRRSGHTQLVVVGADDGLPTMDLSKWGPVEVVRCPRGPIYDGEGNIRFASTFSYSRNVNTILRRYPPYDVYLANDDTALLDGGSPINYLVDTARALDVGLVTPAVQGACSAIQVDDGSRRIRQVPNEDLFFSAVLITRRVFDAVGGLDEIVVPNSHSDTEYTQRSLDRGFRNLVDGRCRISHIGCASFKRGRHISESG